MSTEDRKLVAIMFTDMVGYSALAQRNEALALDVLAEQQRLVRSIFPRFGAREVKTTGDGFFIEFASALEAVRGAIEIQKAITTHNATALAERRFQIRIGVHLGDVVYREGDVFGDGVNIAARIESLAEPGGICVTRAVWEQVHNKMDQTLEAIGPAELKNIRVPVDVYRVVLPWHSGAQVTRPLQAPLRANRTITVLVLALAALVVLVAAVWVVTREHVARAPAIDRSLPSPTGVANSATVRSLAVLPLANYSGDTNQDYFADGMTETLIANLTQIRALDVRSRTSVGQYKGTQKPIPQIAKELHVDTVVEGSVMRVGNQVRITAQLIDAATDHHLWATNYERDITNVLRLQAEVAQDIAAAVQVTLTPQEKAKLAVTRAVNPGAFDAYLRGRQYWYRFTPEGLQKAKEASLEAIQIDPEYAPAYAMLADCYIVLGNMEFLAPKVAYRNAKEALAKALTLDESPEALRAQAAVNLFFDWDWPAAKLHLDRAFELKPNDGDTHDLYADYDGAMGRFDEALDHARREADLEPMVPMASYSVPYVLYLQRHYSEAISELSKMLDLFPYLDPPKVTLGFSHERKGQHAEAIALFRKYLESGRNPVFLAGLGSALAGAGEKDEALKIVAELKAQYDQASRTQEGYVSPLNLAVIYAALDDKPAALEWLQRGFDARAFMMFNLKVDPAWDNLRSEPGFQELLKKMNLDGSGR